MKRCDKRNGQFRSCGFMLVVNLVCLMLFPLGEVFSTGISLKTGNPEEKKVVLKGRVMDKDSLALPGVTVLLKGTIWGVITDVKGNFELSVPEQKEWMLVFSYIGMEPREEKITDSKVNLKIVLKEKVEQLGEVVITGYGETTKRRSPGSVGVLTGETFANKSVTNLDLSLIHI